MQESSDWRHRDFVHHLHDGLRWYVYNFEIYNSSQLKNSGCVALITVTIRQNRGRWQTLLENSECHSVDLLFRVSTFLLAPIIAIGSVPRCLENLVQSY